jgi:hypothetical protein
MRVFFAARCRSYMAEKKAAASAAAKINVQPSGHNPDAFFIKK